MIHLLLAAILEAIFNYRVMQGLPSLQTPDFYNTSYCGQNLLFYRDMASKYYYDFSLPVKQTPHEVVTLGCPIFNMFLQLFDCSIEIISFYCSFYNDLLSLKT